MVSIKCYKKLSYILLITLTSLLGCSKDSDSTISDNPIPHTDTAETGDTTSSPVLDCRIASFGTPTLTLPYTYDSKGRLIKVGNTYPSLSISYVGSLVLATYQTSGNNNEEFVAQTNSEGLITSWINKQKNQEVTITYNTDGYVTRIETKDTTGLLWVELYSWVDGDMLERKETGRNSNNFEDTITYTYTYMKDKLNSGGIGWFEHDNASMFKLVFKPTKHLLTRMDSPTNFLTFSYGFDYRGLPNGMGMKRFNDITPFLVFAYSFKCK